MALPWFESLPVWGDESGTGENHNQPPVRMAVLFHLLVGAEEGAISA